MKGEATAGPDEDFVGKVRRTVERWDMDVSRPLALVSGGPDSVAMLRALVAMESDVEVLYFDHGLRGSESVGDAEFVAALCKELAVPNESVELNLTHEGNFQERARRERYRIAREVAHRSGCTSIATGHNSGDVAETMLMNLSRGTGLRGMSGIPPASNGVIRPLIERSREEVLAYLDSLGQTFRIDSTNLTDEYTRNRIRHEVMPLLEEMYPAVRRNLSKFANIAASDLEVLETLAHLAVERRGREVVVSPERLPHPGLLPHALRIAYSQIKRSLLESGRVEEIMSLVRPGDGTRVLDLPGSKVAVRGEEEIAFYPAPEWRVSALSGVDPARVRLPDLSEVVPSESRECRFQGWRISCLGVDRLDREDAARPEVAYLDAARGPYFVRRVREGDTIRPLGLGGTKKVFRAMMDRKVPSDLRAEMPVIVDGEDKVAWVFLGETDEKYAVSEKTKEILRVEVERS